VKIDEVKSKTDSELNFELGKMKKELFDLRFKSRTAGMTDTSRIRTLRRTIARVLTVQGERRRGEQAGKAQS
jgi:large subunit ribosomal protein L29